MPETHEALKIHFHMNEEAINALTWEEYEALELAQDGQMKLYKVRPLLARFMVDDSGTPLDHQQAMKLLGKLAMNQIKDVLEGFMNALKEKAVPKENGG
ncbi:MAG: hypothetical protein E6Q97_07960 [Desulfurellales bacterium]|jgi:hypothetical protein|nr:MAG: hypothetical protein E6Q97_07960 [Desulfurellales bacterium]